MAGTNPLLIKGAQVWDAEARGFATLDVRCSGARIELVAPHIEPRPGDVTLDAAGGFLLPGLIDCHVHIVSDGGPTDINKAAQEPPGLRAIRAAANARATVMAGFTTVRDLGAPGQLNIQIAKAIDEGLTPGPHVLAAGLGVTMTGGHGHGFLAREADGPDEVRKAVREQLRAGAKAIKLFASGGVLTPGVDPRSPSFTQDELAAGVEEAHKAFRVAAAHAQSTAGIKNAIRAGVDSIEHGVWLDDEAIGLMLERGTYLVATLTAPAVMAERGAAEGVAESAIAKSNQVLADHIASFSAAVRAGVKVAMGTDQGTPLNRPGENAQEILRTARHGLSPAAAILSATKWAAGLLKVEAGEVKPGLLADLVVFRQDPLGNLAALTQTPALVVVDGVAVRNELPSRT
ncbi:MAG: amidohydrolase family protein [Dehalococcoidia bacterium]